jgi:cytochrome c556
MKSLCLTAAAAVFLSALVFAASPEAQKPARIESKSLPNAFQLMEKVISGGQPQGAAAFKELRELGVKTVISVDGAKPNVALAKKYGLRYVHLPHGYDGIPDERLLELTKAVHDLPGLIYIHCHHGKHRSPAAAAAVCVAAGYLSTDEGLAVLAAAGTSPEYRGLYETVRDAQPIDEQTLEEATVEFRETVEIPPLAESMIEVEHTHDHLKILAAAGWKATEKHADIDPAHEALLLREHYTELLRADDVEGRPAEFQNLLKQSEANAQRLEDTLRAGNGEIKKIDRLFERVTADCTACHQKFRDIPLDEKAAAK